MEVRQHGNNIEQLKAEKDGLDVAADIPRFVESGWEAIPKDDVERLKWQGLFLRRRTPGFFMIRIRIPNGVATAGQVAAIARIARKYGRGIADITTRQQLELRWIQIRHVPDIFDRLRQVGLVSLQTGMDNIRNVVGCPLAGSAPNELFDATPVVQEFTRMFVGNRAFTNLPRKFNVTITGCRDNCTHAETQDIALVPATGDIDGKRVPGFNVLVGGKMGSGGYQIASPLDAFVRPEEAAELCGAITLVFRDHGPRDSRSKVRLAFLLDAWGVDRFRHVVEERLGHPLVRAGRDERTEARTDHLGVAKQKQPGLNSVGLVVPVGRITEDQLGELAGLAESYGGGEIRFTTDQNAIIPHVPDERLERLLAEPLMRDLPHNPSPLMRGTVSCTGIDYCNLALIDTKRRALELARALQHKVQRAVTVHWSGCPAGCGNHAVADIGLRGKTIRRNEQVVEAVDVFVGGSSGPGANTAMTLLEDVPCDELPAALEVLIKYGGFDSIRQRLRAVSEQPRSAQPTPAHSGATEVARSPLVIRPEDIPEGQGRVYTVNGAEVAVFRRNGALQAIQNSCPHQEAPLSEGSLDGDEVVCPLHGYRFCVKTGMCSTDPTLKAKTFSLIPDGNGFRIRGGKPTLS